jgi:hypothetical protein
VTLESRRFSIRLPPPLWIGLAAIVLIVIGLGLTMGIPIYEEQAAIRRFEKLDCPCYRESRLPDWRQDWVGPDFLTNEIGRVWQADLSYIEVSDEDVPFLRSFAGIRTLYLADSSITDSGVARLGILPDLINLDLSGTKISDAGLQHLRRFPELAVLWLSNSNITDDGLKYAAEIPKLDSISLDRTKVTAAGIARFKKLRPAVEIDLGGWELDEDVDVHPHAFWKD